MSQARGGCCVLHIAIVSADTTVCTGTRQKQHGLSFALRLNLGGAHSIHAQTNKMHIVISRKATQRRRYRRRTTVFCTSSRSLPTYRYTRRAVPAIDSVRIQQMDSYRAHTDTATDTQTRSSLETKIMSIYLTLAFNRWNMYFTCHHVRRSGVGRHSSYMYRITNKI